MSTSNFPAPAFKGDKTTDNSKPKETACKPTLLYDIIHITGEKNKFYALTHSATEELDSATKQVDDLMLEFSLLVKAEANAEFSPEVQEANLKKRLAWLGKASEAGLIAPNPGIPPEDAVIGGIKPPEPKHDIESCKAELAGLIDLKQGLFPKIPLNNRKKTEYQKTRPLYQMKLAHLEIIEQKIKELEQLQRDDLCHPSNIVEHTFSSDTLVQAGGQSTGGFTVVEFQRFSSDQTQLFYLSRETMTGLNTESKGWIPLQLSEPQLKALADQDEKKAVSEHAEDMLTDFQQQLEKLKTKYDASNLGTLPWFVQAKSGKWETPKHHPWNALYQEIYPKTVSKGELYQNGPTFAFSAEATALRFAAGANLGKVKFEPSKGKLSLTASTDAKYALFEGETSCQLQLPCDAGHQLYVSFRGADGQPRSMEFGHVRFDAKLLLSVFAGVEGQLEANLNIDASKQRRVKPRQANETTGQRSRDLEQSAGAGLLIIPKAEVEIKKKGNWTEKTKTRGKASKDSPALVGLKAEGFAGGRAGAAMTLKTLWKAPKELNNSKQTEASSHLIPEIKVSSSEFTELASVGYVAEGKLGIGAGSHLQLSWENGKFVLHFRASVAFGAGFTGEFKTEVDKKNIMMVIYIVVDALQRCDYRDLTFVDKDTFLILARGLYKVHIMKVELKAEIIEAIFESVQSVGTEIVDWWDDRAATRAESEALARSINQGLHVVNPNKLPPETLGPMLYCLSFNWLFSREESQETAIMNILSQIHSWRHFMQILKHMSEKGDKVDMYQSMQRLTAILDFDQYQEFVNWINQLEVIKPEQGSHNPATPFSPHKYPNNKAQHDSSLKARIQEAWGVTIT